VEFGQGTRAPMESDAGERPDENQEDARERQGVGYVAPGEEGHHPCHERMAEDCRRGVLVEAAGQGEISCPGRVRCVGRV